MGIVNLIITGNHISGICLTSLIMQSLLWKKSLLPHFTCRWFVQWTMFIFYQLHKNRINYKLQQNRLILIGGGRLNQPAHFSNIHFSMKKGVWRSQISWLFLREGFKKKKYGIFHTLVGWVGLKKSFSIKNKNYGLKMPKDA